ncbi:MAG: glycosyltransferase family 4 protein, partial [Synergistetes bacterium]|nr:glycosyltransferase family 4 protein [Synergistota bacterium]
WDNWALLKVDHICFVSYGYREAFLRSLPYSVSVEKTSVIWPGLYIGDRYPSKEELRWILSERYKIPKETFWVSSLGGISERKGTLELVKAFSLFLREGVDAYLFLVGPVREESYFRKVKEASLEAAGRVKFLGYLKDPYPLIKASDLFVFPSRSEGLGSALMEAMALGVPCASTNVEGLRDLVCGGKYAIIIKEVSSEEILKALKEAFENPDRSCKIGYLARERIVRDFSFAKTVEEYEKLYSQFIKNFSFLP